MKLKILRIHCDGKLPLRDHQQVLLQDNLYPSGHRSIKVYPKESKQTWGNEVEIYSPVISFSVGEKEGMSGVSIAGYILTEQKDLYQSITLWLT